MLTLSLQYPLDKALAVSAIGLVTVISILAVIACLILLVSKAIRTLEAAVTKKTNEEVLPKAPSAAVQTVAEKTSQGSVELINTDEKEAAVIMAIVSDKSGIPLEKLSFKTIKLLEDEKKGEN